MRSSVLLLALLWCALARGQEEAPSEGGDPVMRGEVEMEVEEGDGGEGEGSAREGKQFWPFFHPQPQT